MHPMLTIAIQAARQANRLVVQFVDRLSESDVSEKSRNDFVTKVDKIAEDAIVEIIRQSYPSHQIITEEAGVLSGDDSVCWIIDPLDGTTNYIHGFPHFSTSIAVKVKGQLEVSVIYDHLRHEMFTAIKGKGSKMNDRRLRISQCKRLSQALLGTGFPFRAHENLPSYMKTFSPLMSSTKDIRRTGSAALDLAYIAAGRLDGFWEMGLEAWDTAAGTLLIQEAGGIITDFTGSRDEFAHGHVVAGNVKIHRDMLKLIQSQLGIKQ